MPQVLPSAAERQVPFAVQVPVWQEPPQALSAVPAALFVQVPGVARLHAMHVPHFVLEQQTPSTQLPLVHSAPPPHAVPSGFLATQAPDTQYGFVLAHCVSVVHVVRQPVPEHAKPLHDVIVAAVHAPLPSHLRVGVTVPSVQLAAPQVTDVDANTQPVPVPSHALPQVPAAHAVRVP